MVLGLMHRVREPLSVALVAMAAAVSLAAANAAYLRYAFTHPEYSDPLLVLVSKPVILLASLNKVLLPIALRLLDSPGIEDGTRAGMMLSALFGIGTGTLAGTYLLIWAYGMAVSRGGDAFGWGVLRIFKRASIAVCAAYLLFSIWQLVQYRHSLDAGMLGGSVGSAAGLFALAIAGFALLGVVGHYCYAVAKEWHRARNVRR
jgi:hypothetical protein